MAQRGHDFDNVRTSSRDKSPKISEQVDMLQLPKDKYITVRIVSGVFMYSGYWVLTKNKDGKKTRYYMPSPSYDPESQSFDSTKYDPFYAVAQTETGEKDREKRLIQIQSYGYCNVIVLAEEKKRPGQLPRHTPEEKKSGFKDKDSDSWTPVRVMRLSSTMMKQIKNINQTNVIRNRKTGESKSVSIAHPQFGMTIRVKHSPDEPPATQYSIMPGERAPLSERQEAYLTWDLSDLEQPEGKKEVQASYERWSKTMGLKARKSNDGDDADGFDQDDNDDFSEEDDDNRGRGGKRNGKSSGKSNSRGNSRGRGRDNDDDGDDDGDGDFDENDEFGDEGDGDDDGDDRGRGRGRSSGKSNSRGGKSNSRGRNSRDNDDDFGDDDGDQDGDGDDDGFGDDDDDQDDRGSRGRGNSRGGKSNGKRQSNSRGRGRDSDDDFGDDDGDGDDDGFGDDDGDDDQDDRGSRGRGGKSNSRGNSRGRNSRDSDDDFGDDDGDGEDGDGDDDGFGEDEDDQDDRKPARRQGKPAARRGTPARSSGKPAARRGKPANRRSRDDDDDIPF